VVVEQIPWSEGKRTLTTAMMGFLARWAWRLSWRETSQVFQTSWESVYHSVEWFVEWGLAHRQLDGIESIGVDEIHWGHGQKADNFLTVIYQIDAGCRRLLLTGNRRDGTFRATNGELVKVRNVDGGWIHLEDGRTLPDNYHEFDHGYAVTAHRSQGKTVDAVILSADAMKQELFYVGASRGRQEIVVVTSDREQLRELLGISTARPSATELARVLTRTQPASRLDPRQSPSQTIEPSVLRQKSGHRHDLGMSR
jgi:hypothetical protein